MAETAPIAEIAVKLSKDIFSHFHWKTHPKLDVNFNCHNSNHQTAGKKARPKKSHPGDIVFNYVDPYTGRETYLHTDLKSYGKTSISAIKVRQALESLAMTIECARESSDWQQKYSVDPATTHEVRGLLFVHNHDNTFKDSFDNVIEKTHLDTLNIGPNVYIHFLGPNDIDRLYTICNDLIRLKYERLIPELYTFYYPDLFLWHRRGDVFGQPATIEAITSPYFVIKYSADGKISPGYLIYYNRQGKSADEFLYFLDSLSRFQMLESGQTIRVRMTATEISGDFKSNFLSAVNRYVKAWGFDKTRQEILENIIIDRVTAVVTSYSIADMGWKDKSV